MTLGIPLASSRACDKRSPALQAWPSASGFSQPLLCAQSGARALNIPQWLSPTLPLGREPDLMARSAQESMAKDRQLIAEERGFGPAFTPPQASDPPTQRGVFFFCRCRV